MKSRQECINIIVSHADDLHTKYGVRSLILFGSVARDEQREDSDVDVLVDMPPHLLDACAAADYLEELLGCKVDLVRRHKNLSPFFLKQIQNDGIPVFHTA